MHSTRTTQKTQSDYGQIYAGVPRLAVPPEENLWVRRALPPALVGLVLGVLALFSWFAGIPALVFGAIAVYAGIRGVRRAAEAAVGKPLSVLFLVVGTCGMVLGVMGIVGHNTLFF